MYLHFIGENNSLNPLAGKIWYFMAKPFSSSREQMFLIANEQLSAQIRRNLGPFFFGNDF